MLASERTDAGGAAFLDATELASRLRVSRSRAYELMRQMPRLVAGRTVRVSEAAFEAWVRQHVVVPAERAPALAPMRATKAERAAIAAPIRLTFPRTKPRVGLSRREARRG